MAAYYNEYDPQAAAWLRELIAARLIAPGEVDERSIEDVLPSDLTSFNQVHLFAGIGGWSLALRMAGIHDDEPIWTGSCPCQPFSSAGKGRGLADERHLWPAMHHLVDVCRPPVVFGEQVASKDGLEWLDLVSADLEGSGYAFGAADLCAAGVGAPHRRQRLYWVGQSHGPRLQERGEASEADGHGSSADAAGWACDWVDCRDGKRRPVEPGTFPLAHGLPEVVGRLRGYGNAVVPQVAAGFVMAWYQTQ